MSMNKPPGLTPARLVPLALLVLLGPVGLAAGCGPTGSSTNNNDDPRDAGLDAALLDAAPVDAAPSDAGAADAIVAQDAASNLVDGAGLNQWQVKAVNGLLLTEPTRLAAHPSAPTTLAVLPAATAGNLNMAVFRTTDGLTFNPVTIVSFADTPGFFGAPKGLAYDPHNGAALVASMQPVPPPNTDLAMVLAWSEDGGASFTHPWAPWATPWPPEEMRFVGGPPSTLVWRSAARFHFSADHGVTFGRVETLEPLPSGCGLIQGFDMPGNDHDRVALWCDTGGAHLCDLVTDQCTALGVTGTTVGLGFAPGNPLVLHLFTTDHIWRSDDSGLSIHPVHAFSASTLRVDPGNAARACALRGATGELRCTMDGGATWMDITPPVLQGGTPTLILDLAFASNGRLWAVGHPGVVSNTAF